MVAWDVSLTGVLADRPNVVLNANPLPHTLKQWFDPADFVQQATGTFGNAGRDSIFAPGSFNWDMALSRQFKFKERYRLDVRADFFNVMNHANWNGPTTSITSGTFGQITTFGGPRIIQLSSKFFF